MRLHTETLGYLRAIKNKILQNICLFDVGRLCIDKKIIQRYYICNTCL